MSGPALTSLPEGPFVLRNVSVPAAFCDAGLLPADAKGVVQADLGVSGGRLTAPNPDWPVVEAGGHLALPPFVDAHTHLDKAYTVGRTGLGDGTLMGAIRVLMGDEPQWTAEDLSARMRRGAARALSYGTGVMRTHLDTMSLPDETQSWDVFADVQAAFAGSLTLQPVALAAVERAELPDFEQRCAQVSRRGGVLGAFIAPGVVPRSAILALLQGATRYGLDVDFHVGENLVPGDPALRAIADCIIETGFEGRVVAGHCCSLSLLEGGTLSRELDRVAEAGIHVIALPTSNTFLQDRRAEDSPRRRGIAPLRELMAAGVPVSTASDNVQDAFFPFGDFDMVDVLRTIVLGCHLDGDLEGAIDLGLRGGAQAMGQTAGRLALSGPADLTLFAAKDWFDLLSGTPGERIVLRAGARLETQV